MRVCVIGNSHVACLKFAWDLLEAEFAGFRVTFFAEARDALAELELSDGAMALPKSVVPKVFSVISGGGDEIRLSDYDVFLVFGLRLVLPLIENSVSSAVSWRCCEDNINAATNVKICRLIRSQSSARVFAGHVPQRARVGMAQFEPGVFEGRYRSYDQVFGSMANILAADGVEFVQQPRETFSNGWNTKSELSRGARTLPRQGNSAGWQIPDHDIAHMNAAFGAIYWRAFIDVLAPGDAGAQ